MDKLQWLAKRSDAAAFFRCSLPTIDAWIRHGCPVLERTPNGRIRMLDLSAMTDWKIREVQGRTRDPQAERARRDSEAADKLALENAKTRGQITDVTEVAALWSSSFSELRTRLRGIPSNAAPSLIGCTREEIRAFLEVAIDDALASLADSGPGVAGSAETAAEADGEPVGGSPPAPEPGVERGAGAMDDG